MLQDLSEPLSFDLLVTEFNFFSPSHGLIVLSFLPRHRSFLSLFSLLFEPLDFDLHG